MHLRNAVLWLGLLILTATLCVTGQSQLVTDENAFEIPTEGTLDQRPFFSSRRHPQIRYEHQPTTDVVGELGKKLEAGQVQLRFQGSGGYLQSLLAALNVPAESQALVFSKTSLQSHYINPKNPRAIYFNDDVSVAFIRGAPLLEISALDPRQGVVFYAIDNQDSRSARVLRSDSCLSCHESRNSLHVPGLLARSMAVGLGGETMPQVGNFISDHRSRFEERWGGWYITGRTGSARHMGNEMLDPGATMRTPVVPRTLGSVEGWVDDLNGYPSKYSDVAAVMILDHQVGMTNRLTRVGWEARVALDRQAFKPQEKEAVERLLAANTKDLVDYMLFVDEPVMSGVFQSTSGFQAKFAASGLRDKKGRSLKQLDLGKRLLRYPCSYMIYSPAFDSLPDPAKSVVYARLWEILSGREKAARYSKLTSADRAAIVSILIDTKPGLPPYFKRLER